MKKKLILFILLTALTAAITLTLTSKPPAELRASAAASLTMVIDAGHGGADMGASAPDGTGEPEITLAIARALEEEAAKYGVKTILTRKDNNGLMEEDAGGTWSKLSDMRQRKKIIEEAGAQVILSIHLNSFTEDSSVRGAQVFYPDEESRALAESITDALRTGVNDGTNRGALSKKDMYLFKNMTQKRILVECGFLSNPVDLAVLKTPAHQKKLAKYIMEGVAKEEKLTLELRENTEVIDSLDKNEIRTEHVNKNVDNYLLTN